MPGYGLEGKTRTKQNGRADPLPLSSNLKSLFPPIHCLLQLGPRCELRDAAGGNLDGCPRLGIAAIACFPSATRKKVPNPMRATLSPFLSAAVMLSTDVSTAVAACGFADPVACGNPVNKIGFVHLISSQVSQFSRVQAKCTVKL